MQQCRKRGFKIRTLTGSSGDLQFYLDRAVPVIVKVETGFWRWRKQYFMVVTGYNKGGVIVNWLDRPYDFLPKEVFLPMWKKTNYWTTLIGK